MKKKLLLSICSGILLGISFPTFGFPIFVFFAFVPLLLVEQDLIIYKEKKSYFKVFCYSYLTFVIWNIIVIHWLYFAKRPDGSYAIEALLFPVFANSFLMSLVFLMYHFVKKTAGSYVGLLFFPCIWIAFEWFHLDWECSFPWLNLGNVFADFHTWIQWYEFTGSFGGTLWVLLINIFIFYNYRAYQASRKREFVKKLLIYVPIFILVPIFISLIRYYSYDEKGEKIEVVVIQPELDSYSEKYELDSLIILNTVLNLGSQKITPKTKFVVAPETAFPGLGSISYENREKNYLLNQIRNWVKTSKNPNLAFVSGTKFMKQYDIHKVTSSVFYNPYTQKYEEHFNSAVEVTAKDTLEAYQKIKLVVGVEKLPYNSILNEYFSALSEIFGGSMHSLGIQKESEVFTNQNISVAPIICYESIYGEFVTQYVNKGADALFIMTNDSWWEESQGYKQLLAFAKLRAIENRRSIARSANSGVSCFINQRGDIISRLDYLKKGSLKGEIHLNKSKTSYTKYGDYIARIALLFLGGILAYILSKFILKKLKL